MKYIKSFVLACLLAQSGSAIAWQNDHTLYSDPLEVGSYIENVKPLVISGVKRYGWVIDRDAPGVLSVRYEQDGIIVEADIEYDQNRIVINSDGPALKPDCTGGCEVHEQSQYWLVNVRRAIALELHGLAIADAGGSIEGRYFEPDLESFTERVMSDDARTMITAAQDVANGYVYEQPYLDVVADRLWQLKSSEDGRAVNAAARFAKALAKSNGSRYKNIIAEVAESAPDERLRRHAEAALAAIIEAKGAVEPYVPTGSGAI